MSRDESDILTQLSPKMTDPQQPTTTQQSEKEHSSKACPPLAPRLAPPWLLELPDELLERVLSFLPAQDLLHAAQVCHKFARCAEHECLARCRKRGLRVPRRPRGYLAAAPFPKRYFYHMQLCVNCHREGAWILRRGRRAVQVGVACKQCLHDRAFQAMLDAHHLTVDVYSKRGAKLTKL
ncbi:hypothetical protein PTSG_01829 [Salpingoeca rosetta]|uniref:F-box domain-containing protein n=1 Tax=Salpingoeca rosetta (strain ATCC 50818 / BSB-021) TaxID=946362 RepID=F2TZ27_SALR5|nr:uncharacterized protein PTSG_01829 [Salpingoeca rosetta]EGD78851.1 hypothetical protein PTSG_01829 [Salpingoeca rosetta]|eukprot:XP_004997807.1 hypothetical protein PTSG_01829 [Salpingoeca rosetta]